MPAMLGNSIRLFRIAGIDVGVHISWLVIFGLVTWSLAVGVFPTADGLQGQPAAVYWLLGAITAVLLFASVLLHELAHSLVAKRKGLGVKSITLFIFGGVSNLTGEAKNPSTEFTIAIVGPLTSLAIAAVVYVVDSVFSLPPAVDAVLSYLVYINVALGLFNLVPGFPLDGGRVLRAIAWTSTGSLRRGTEIAAFVGQLVAWGLLLFGAYQILVVGEFLNGIWIGAIGWFLQNAAQTSLQQVLMEQRLRGARVADVVEPDPTVVSPNTSVRELIEEYVLRGNRRAVPVARDGQIIGMVTLRDVQHVPKEEWDTTRVVDVMGGRDGVVTVSSRSTLQAALEALAKGDYEQVPVVDDGRLVGVVSRADIVRQIQLREALDVEGALPKAARGEPAPGEAT
jgi:Zn-dependent protease/CBS domain-containing protein